MTVSRRLFALACTLCAFPLVVAGCEGAGPGIGGGVRERGPVMTEYERYAALGYRLEWRGAPLVGSGRRSLFVEAYDDALVFQDTGNILTYIDSTTGLRRWSAEVDRPLAKFVGVTRANGRVYSASDTELFEFDQRTGELHERHNLAEIASTAPVVIGSIAVLGTISGEVLGHSLVSTYKQWGYRLSGSIDGKPVRTGDAVAAVSQRGDVIVLNPATGASFSRARLFGGVANNPVADATTVYIASLDQSVYAISADRGATRWRHRAEHPIRAQPTLHGDRLYVEIPYRGLVCFNAGDGSIVWEAASVRGEVIGVRDGALLVWDGRVAHTLDPARGDVVQRVEITGLFALVTDRFEDGNLYSVTPDGRVSRWSPRF